MITAALASRQYHLLQGIFNDRLHQPYRQKLLPELYDTITAGEQAGALGGWLSGSGSTLMCLTLKNPTAVAAAMKQVFTKRKRNCHTTILVADNRGLQISAR
jgi:homoserine kinase